jgi:SAM-dependent methyltransferase
LCYAWRFSRTEAEGRCVVCEEQALAVTNLDPLTRTSSDAMALPHHLEFTHLPDDPYGWDARVEAWEQVAASDAFLALRDHICDRAAPSPTDRVLDLGAGSGLITLALAPRVSEVVAVDISPRMLDRLGERAAADGISNVACIVGDLRTLPFDDASFTLAVSNYAFHHLDDVDKELALSEVRRVLTPAGRLVLCDMMFSLSLEPRDRRLLTRKLWAIARRGPAGLLRIARNAGRVAVGRWEHPAPPEAWARMLSARHFEDVQVELLEHEAGLATAQRPEGRHQGIGRTQSRKALTLMQS